MFWTSARFYKVAMPSSRKGNAGVRGTRGGDARPGQCPLPAGPLTTRTLLSYFSRGGQKDSKAGGQSAGSYTAASAHNALSQKQRVEGILTACLELIKMSSDREGKEKHWFISVDYPNKYLTAPQHFPFVGHGILKQRGQSAKYSGVRKPLNHWQIMHWKMEKTHASRIKARLPSPETFADPDQGSRHSHKPGLGEETRAWQSFLTHNLKSLIPTIHFCSGDQFLRCPWQLLCIPLRQSCHHKAFIFVVIVSTKTADLPKQTVGSLPVKPQQRQPGWRGAMCLPLLTLPKQQHLVGLVKTVYILLPFQYRGVEQSRFFSLRHKLGKCGDMRQRGWHDCGISQLLQGGVLSILPYVTLPSKGSLKCWHCVGRGQSYSLFSFLTDTLPAASSWLQPS